MVLAGTKEGREIAEKLSCLKFSVIASAATDYGGKLLEGKARARIGPLNAKSLECFIREKNVDMVIDATHPFAMQISLNAIDACRNAKIKYIRYEREGGGEYFFPDLIRVKDFDEAATEALKFERIFLTIGSKNLDKFAMLKKRGKSITARVLPTSEVLKKCEDLGFLPGEIIAMEGPFSLELNYCMFKDCRAEVVITKDSGSAGGVLEKLRAAEKLHIPAILVERPAVNYPLVVGSMEEILEEIRKDLS
ncbi:MAG: precorrin-6A reductase [Tepidanaerobacteraceae bacterium]|jgi:precorrin-6A/cobalt-precorrin-6A reductase|nr:precorrin-6A reductase [Tepidanaerobacteraceae bacterium]